MLLTILYVYAERYNYDLYVFDIFESPYFNLRLGNCFSLKRLAEYYFVQVLLISCNATSQSSLVNFFSKEMSSY